VVTDPDPGSACARDQRQVNRICRRRVRLNAGKGGGFGSPCLDKLRSKAGCQAVQRRARSAGPGLGDDLFEQSQTTVGPFHHSLGDLISRVVQVDERSSRTA